MYPRLIDRNADWGYVIINDNKGKKKGTAKDKLVVQGGVW